MDTPPTGVTEKEIDKIYKEVIAMNSLHIVALIAFTRETLKTSHHITTNPETIDKLDQDLEKLANTLAQRDIYERDDNLPATNAIRAFTAALISLRGIPLRPVGIPKIETNDFDN